MWQVKTRGGGLAPVSPGALRTGLVEVGTHVSPAPEIVPAMLARLDEGCRAADGLDQIVAIAAMHHRLLWVHPFDDGNGRVARLVSHGQIVRAGLDAGGLWSISRGLARHRDQYRNALAAADSRRQGSTDGRGNLSARALGDFCEFFLSTMLDQIRFMRECLNFESFADRLHKYVSLSGTFGRHDELVWLLLREAWARGSFTRGDAARITNTSERMARNLSNQTCPGDRISACKQCYIMSLIYQFFSNIINYPFSTAIKFGGHTFVKGRNLCYFHNQCGFNNIQFSLSSNFPTV
jgi:Fic family protein